MTDEQFQQMMAALAENNALLRQLIQQLNQQSDAERPAPNYQSRIEDFQNFDWASIGATVEYTDSDGVAVVSWRGNQFLRRSAQNKFKPAIWFSRAVGKDENGENRYERLISFKQLAEVEPLPEKVRRLG
jgi:DdrB-like protein